MTWRTATGRPAPPHVEQVEAALCFGWIDSTRKKIDEERTMIYFAPRRPGSQWARTNQGHIERLEAAGRLRPSGRAIVDRAKADGSWISLDDVEDLVVPDDLWAALDRHDGARAHWDAFSPLSRKLILWWVLQAKRPETRGKRVEETARQAAQGIKAR